MSGQKIMRKYNKEIKWTHVKGSEQICGEITKKGETGIKKESVQRAQQRKI